MRPSIRPKTKVENITTEIAAPTQSSPPFACGALDSGTKIASPTKIKRPSGRLIRNAQRQSKSVASQPPRTGPTATIPPMVAPQTAKAMPRSLPWKLAFTKDRVVGSTMAPPIPCTILARISADEVSAEPAQTEEKMKMAIPILSRRFRPMRSATEPQTKSKEANTNT